MARPSWIRRYTALFGVQLRASVLTAMQYRLDFIVDSALTFFYVIAALVPLGVLFHHRDTVAGWPLEDALLVVAFFSILKGVLQGAIQPSLGSVVDHIRKGTLDFVLLKPAGAWFLVSTSRFELARIADVFAGLLILGYALNTKGLVPGPTQIAACLLMLLAGTAALYALATLVASVAFRVVKVDNLGFLFGSIFDAARWPSSVFTGVVAFIFTFVIPLALMTTWPALALLDQLSLGQAALALGVSGGFVAVGSLVWHRSIGAYTSAGG